jgi:hypothetical protein
VQRTPHVRPRLLVITVLSVPLGPPVVVVRAKRIAHFFRGKAFFILYSFFLQQKIFLGSSVLRC